MQKTGKRDAEGQTQDEDEQRNAKEVRQQRHEEQSGPCEVPPPQQGTNKTERVHQRSGEEQGPPGPGGSGSESAAEGVEETEWEGRLRQEHPELEGRTPRSFALSRRVAKQNDGKHKPPLTKNEKKACRLAYRNKVDKMDIHRIVEVLEQRVSTTRQEHKSPTAQEHKSPTAQEHKSPTAQQHNREPAQKHTRRSRRKEEKEIEEEWLPIIRVTPCNPPRVGGCMVGDKAGGGGRQKRSKGLPDDKLPADSKD